MKSTFCNVQWLVQSIRGIMALTALALVGPAANGQAVPKSPVGTTWDCVISGARSGIGYLVFSTNDNGSFMGCEILVPNAPHPPQPDLVRVATPLNGLGVRPPVTNDTKNIYGFTFVSGPWGFDRKGRTIGYFVEAGADVTNAVNFSATVVPGKRLTLLAHTPLGGVVWRGVPAPVPSNVSGEWYGMERQGGASSVEFCSLTSWVISTDDALPGWNGYWVDGAGADCSYTDAVFLLSSQKRAAFCAGMDDGSIRAVVGPFFPRTQSARMKGIDSLPGMGALTNRVSFQMWKRTSLP